MILSRHLFMGAFRSSMGAIMYVESTLSRRLIVAVFIYWRRVHGVIVIVAVFRCWRRAFTRQLNELASCLHSDVCSVPMITSTQRVGATSTFANGLF